jgi:hypothetical protein
MYIFSFASRLACFIGEGIAGATGVGNSVLVCPSLVPGFCYFNAPDSLDPFRDAPCCCLCSGGIGALYTSILQTSGHTSCIPLQQVPPHQQHHSPDEDLHPVHIRRHDIYIYIYISYTATPRTRPLPHPVQHTTFEQKTQGFCISRCPAGSINLATHTPYTHTHPPPDICPILSDLQLPHHPYSRFPELCSSFVGCTSNAGMRVCVYIHKSCVHSVGGMLGLSAWGRSVFSS